ncbi:MAG: preprotein translocase subunit SecY [Candidatus Omnitrophica bacterium]|nr:preprotein translocase subunit SecY [Candidatus Omnitrophota bacterium]
MLKALANSFKVPELRARILVTLGLIAVYRMGDYIPLPGIDGQALRAFFERMSQQMGGTLFTVMDLFSGGGLSQMTIFALGIMPAISASIIMQLLVVVIPRLEQMAKEEGEAGRRNLNQYSRYLTVGLGILQAFFIALWLENPRSFDGVQMVQFPGWGFRLLTIITLASGTAFIMWLGEQITAMGIGNGMSILITAGILSRMPTAIHQLVLLANPLTPGRQQIQPIALAGMAVMLIAVIVAVIAITQGQRRIPVQYARRVVGRKVFGGQATYIPIRVNHAGVMPIIFAQSIIMFPATLAGFTGIGFLGQVANWLSRGHGLYTLLYSAFIIFFAYFYTAIAFNPVDVSDNMKKFGGFIPGIRPGRPTAEFFDRLLTRITLPGAIFLAFIAVLPDMIGRWLSIPYLVASFFGGTSLLIIVGVLLETMRQVESFLLMRNYEGFLSHGRLRGRR